MRRRRARRARAQASALARHGRRERGAAFTRRAPALLRAHALHQAQAPLALAVAHAAHDVTAVRAAVARLRSLRPRRRLEAAGATADGSLAACFSCVATHTALTRGAATSPTGLLRKTPLLPHLGPLPPALLPLHGAPALDLAKTVHVLAVALVAPRGSVAATAPLAHAFARRQCPRSLPTASRTTAPVGRMLRAHGRLFPRGSRLGGSRGSSRPPPLWRSPRRHPFLCHRLLPVRAVGPKGSTTVTTGGGGPPATKDASWSLQPGLSSPASGGMASRRSVTWSRDGVTSHPAGFAVDYGRDAETKRPASRRAGGSFRADCSRVAEGIRSPRRRLLPGRRRTWTR